MKVRSFWQWRDLMKLQSLTTYLTEVTWTAEPNVMFDLAPGFFIIGVYH